MRVTPSPVLPAILGFAMTLGAFGAALTGTLLGDAPVLLPEKAAMSATADATLPQMKLYLPLPEVLTLNLQDGRAALIALTLSIEGPVDILTALQGTLVPRMDDVKARILAEAQSLAQGADASAALRRDLPARLRELLNGTFGTEALPEPVREVLVTEFILR